MELSEEQRTDANIEILNQFNNDAPTDEIKHILGLYSVNKNNTDIYAEMKSKPRKDVQATAQHLGLASTGYNPTLAKAISMKSESYLISTCAVCLKLYCIRPDEKPLFCCKRCGQGCHHDGVSPLIGKSFAG